MRAALPLLDRERLFRFFAVPVCLQKLVCLLTNIDHLVHHGIKGLTMRTLDSQKMPGPIPMPLLTIVAGNVRNATQFGRNRLHGNS
jgi:hypothetical protein